MIGTGSKHGRLFLLDVGLISLFASSLSTSNNLWTTWHRRLGHLNNDKLAFLFRDGCLDPSLNKNMLTSLLKSQCVSCCVSNSHVLPFPIHYSHAIAAFDMIHTDVWGIAPQSLLLNQVDLVLNTI